MADIVVIGGSIMGASVAYHLAEAGHAADVCVVEPDPTYEWAAAPRSAGGVRLMYSLPESIAMSRYGREVYLDLARLMDVMAKVTVLGEGVRGSLTKQLVERFELQGEFPQVYETGIKEIWRDQAREAQARPGDPRLALPGLLQARSNGMWLYDMKDNLVSYGFVTPLDSSENPNNDPHLACHRIFKTTPFMRRPPRGRGAGPLRRQGDSHRRHLRPAQALRGWRTAGGRLRLHAATS